MSLSDSLYLLGDLKLLGTRTNARGGLTVSFELYDAATGAEVSVPAANGANMLQRDDDLLFFVGLVNENRVKDVIAMLGEAELEDNCGKHGFSFLGRGQLVKETIRRSSTGKHRVVTRLQIDVWQEDGSWLSTVLHRGILLRSALVLTSYRSILTYDSSTDLYGDLVEIERLCRNCSGLESKKPDAVPAEQQELPGVLTTEGTPDAHDLALQRIAARAIVETPLAGETLLALAASQAGELLDKLYGLLVYETISGRFVTVGLMTQWATRHGASDDVARRIGKLLSADKRFVVEASTADGPALALVTPAETGPAPAPEPAQAPEPEPEPNPNPEPTPTPAPEASVPDAEADALAASQTRARVAERTAELCRRQDMGSMRLALLRMRISAEFGAETPTLQELEDLLRERSDVFSLVSVGTAQKGEMLVCLR